MWCCAVYHAVFSIYITQSNEQVHSYTNMTLCRANQTDVAELAQDTWLKWSCSSTYKATWILRYTIKSKFVFFGNTLSYKRLNQSISFTLHIGASAAVTQCKRAAYFQWFMWNYHTWNDSPECCSVASDPVTARGKVQVQWFVYWTGYTTKLSPLSESVDSNKSSEQLFFFKEMLLLIEDTEKNSFAHP